MCDIRKATLDDIPVIHALAMEVFPYTYREILSSDQIDYMMVWMYSIDNLRKQMLEDGHIYYLAYQKGKAVAYLSIQSVGEHLFHLQKLYVLPSYQGMHLGEKLFEQAVKAIRELHPTPCQMRLNVNRFNKALIFYEKMGMRKVDVGDFPIGNGYYMNDYIMGMDI